MRLLAPVLLPPSRGADGRPGGPPPLNVRILLGLFSILLGAFISNLDTRLTAFSLADLRGGVGLGVDEASWVSTAYNVAEIAVVPVTPWLAGVISARRATAGSIILLTLAGALCPWAADRGYVWLLTARFVQGLGGGALIPLLLGIFLGNLPLHQRVYGFALYALVTASTPLISESVAGVLTDIVGWQSIFYIGVAIGPVVLFLALYGLPALPVNWEAFRTADYPGIVLCAVWTSLLTAALGQGQRLDWFDSPLIGAMFVSAGCVFAAFLLVELTRPAPLFDLGLLLRFNFSAGLVVVLIFAASTLMTSAVLPNYGQEVRGFRETQIGAILIWAALVQVAVCALAPMIMQRLEARVVLALALLLASIGARMATFIDSDWVQADILPSHLIQAGAQPLIMLALVVIATGTLQAKDALAGGTLFNTVRTLAGSVGGAVVGAIQTVRERVHSATLADHLLAGAPAIVQRHAGELAGALRVQAETMAAADSYGWIGMTTLCCIGLALLMRGTSLFAAPAPGSAP